MPRVFLSHATAERVQRIPSPKQATTRSQHPMRARQLSRISRARQGFGQTDRLTEVLEANVHRSSHQQISLSQ